MTEIDAGRRVLARFHPVKVSLAVLAFGVVAGFALWLLNQDILTRHHPLDIAVLAASIIVAILIGAGPVGGAWRLLARDGEAVWVAEGRLHWSPWCSTPVDGITRVREALFARDRWFKIVIERGSTLPTSISTALYDTDRESLMRAIQALKPGLGGA